MIRRLRMLCWVLLASAGSSLAVAEPYIAVTTGLKCSACHVNPTGGGLRNTFGNIWGQTSLPAKGPEGGGAPWTGELGRFIAMGADLRGSATLLDQPGSSATSSFDFNSLRAYLDLHIIPDRLSLYIDERLAPGNATNAEGYVRLWTRDRRYYMKAGQMYLPFGIRLQDDGAFTRTQTGISFNTPDRGVEFGFDGTHWTGQLAITNGTAGAAEVDNGKQWSLRSEYVAARGRVGASVNLNDFDGSSRRMTGLFAGLRTGPVAWLAEADYIVDRAAGPDVKQWAALLEANWNFRKGHTLKLTAERFDPDRDASADRQTRLSLLWEYTPLPFLQIRSGIRNHDDDAEVPFLNQRIVFVQLHGYL